MIMVKVPSVTCQACLKYLLYLYSSQTVYLLIVLTFSCSNYMHSIAGFLKFLQKLHCSCKLVNWNEFMFLTTDIWNRLHNCTHFSYVYSNFCFKECQETSLKRNAEISLMFSSKSLDPCFQAMLGRWTNPLYCRRALTFYGSTKVILRCY